MTTEQVADLLQEVLKTWPLYTEKDHIRAHSCVDRLCVSYCGDFDGVPWMAGTRFAKDPPHLLEINIIGDILYLLFIQVDPKYRGKGYGAQLYDLVVEFARRFGCSEVRQFPSGGYGDQSREEYLLKRGWTPCPDSNEVRKFTESTNERNPRDPVARGGAANESVRSRTPNPSSRNDRLVRRR